MDHQVGSRTISVEVRPGRGRVIIAGAAAIVEDACGNTATFDVCDLTNLSEAIVEATVRRDETRRTP
jgi:hypothetical protein